MIDGEIYALNSKPKVVFAYCEKGTCDTSFYVGVTSRGEAVISRKECIYGMSFNSASHLATEEERERFHSILKSNGLVWNQSNKVIIKDNKEIIKI